MASLEKVERELAKVNEQRETLRQKALELTRQRDQLAAEETAKAKVAAMSDAERAALAQFVKPKGIPSAEKVGGR